MGLASLPRGSCAPIALPCPCTSRARAGRCVAAARAHKPASSRSTSALLITESPSPNQWGPVCTGSFRPLSRAFRLGGFFGPGKRRKSSFVKIGNAHSQERAETLTSARQLNPRALLLKASFGLFFLRMSVHDYIRPEQFSSYFQIIVAILHRHVHTINGRPCLPNKTSIRSNRLSPKRK